jgi:hypothetical protein
VDRFVPAERALGRVELQAVHGWHDIQFGTFGEAFEAFRLARRVHREPCPERVRCLVSHLRRRVEQHTVVSEKDFAFMGKSQHAVPASREDGARFVHSEDDVFVEHLSGRFV